MKIVQVRWGKLPLLIQFFLVIVHQKKLKLKATYTDINLSNSRVIQETRVNFVCLSVVLEPSNFPFFIKDLNFTTP